MKENYKIKVENLSFSFNGEKKVLNDISFSVANEHCVSFVGMSGAGKTTLLKAICNLTNSKNTTEGKVLINGFENKRFINENRGKIGFMFQSSALMPNLTVEENIKFPSKIINNKGQDNQLFEKIIRIVGLHKNRNKLPNELSGGMKSRLSLASVYMTKPEILLLDEPFSSLDVAWKYELYQKFFELKKQFRTTEIVVTHDIQEAILLSNEIFVIKIDGTLGQHYTVERHEDIISIGSLKRFLKKYNDMYLNIQDEILLDMKNKDFTT